MQELNGKLALCGVDGDAVGGQTLEDDLQMAAMFVFVGTRDENVIDVHKNEGQVSEDAVHETLKELRSIAKAERHLNKLEEAERGSDGSLQLVIWMNWVEMIGTHQID